jgi:tRNA (cytidine/uridine-2'-O-)-methyltransferase
VSFHIVLVEPEIPQNTGNIARTCAATGASLHLVEPLGFSLESKYLKRAGLDYWDLLDLHIYPGLEQFMETHAEDHLYMVTTKAERHYAQVTYEQEAYFLFGKESQGLSESLIMDYRNTAIRIPMISASRSLNLSNSVAIIAYEFLRQHEFPDLLLSGQLHRHSWD